MGREGKFKACIPGNHGKREFPLTPDLNQVGVGMEVLVELGCHLGKKAYKRSTKRSWRGGGEGQRKLRAVESAIKVDAAMEVE